MAALAEQSELARELAIWSLAGAAMVAAAAWYADGRIEGASDVALILTGAGCARICRVSYAGPEAAQA